MTGHADIIIVGALNTFRCTNTVSGARCEKIIRASKLKGLEMVSVSSSLRLSTSIRRLGHR